MTTEDVARVAKKYLDPDHMLVLIVGDRAQIEPELKSLPYAKVLNVLDADGDPEPTVPLAPGESTREVP